MEKQAVWVDERHTEEQQRALGLRRPEAMRKQRVVQVLRASVVRRVGEGGARKDRRPLCIARFERCDRRVDHDRVELFGAGYATLARGARLAKNHAVAAVLLQDPPREVGVGVWPPAGIERHIDEVTLTQPLNEIEKHLWGDLATEPGGRLREHTFDAVAAVEKPKDEALDFVELLVFVLTWVKDDEDDPCRGRPLPDHDVSAHTREFKRHPQTVATWRAQGNSQPVLSRFGAGALLFVRGCCPTSKRR